MDIWLGGGSWQFSSFLGTSSKTSQAPARRQTLLLCLPQSSAAEYEQKSKVKAGSSNEPGSLSFSGDAQPHCVVRSGLPACN